LDLLVQTQGLQDLVEGVFRRHRTQWECCRDDLFENREQWRLMKTDFILKVGWLKKCSTWRSLVMLWCNRWEQGISERGFQDFVTAHIHITYNTRQYVSA
jgi:hypothetical protein